VELPRAKELDTAGMLGDKSGSKRFLWENHEPETFIQPIGVSEIIMEVLDKRTGINKCKACGQVASKGPFCRYCQEMRDELRCWPK
jgi:recombinational DNA repair protein RecR